MRRIIVLLAVLAFAVPACEGEVELITVPDFSGMRLLDVRERFEALDLELEEVDGSGQDRAVFSPGNWSVEGQDPGSGAEVEPGVTVLVSLVNDRDQEPEPEPEPEPADEPEPEPELEPADDPEAAPAEEPEPVEEPEAEDESTIELEADVSQIPVGLQFVTDADYDECRLNLNSGVIRSGYTREVTNVVAGSPVIVPWGELTNRDGERFDYARVRPEMATIDCDASDGGWAVSTWNW